MSYRHHVLTLITAFAAAGLGASSAHAQDAVQWPVEDGGNGHWYHGVNLGNAIGWEAARQLALQHGGDLIATETADEKSLMFDTFSLVNRPDLYVYNGEVGPYIGARQESGSTEPSSGWEWVSGVAFDPSTDIGCCNDNCNGLPEDVLHLSTYTGGWNDAPGIPAESCIGSQVHSAIIEWSADCNGDGIVDYGQILDGTFADDDGDGVPDLCDAVQWLVEDGGNGHWYAVIRLPQETNWYDAAVAANLIGSHLATATDQDEAAILRDLAGDPAGWVGRAGPWAGGFQNRSSRDYTEPAGGWEWITGETWFPVWDQRSDEPNNAGGNEDFLHLIADGDSQCNPDLSTRKWNDLGLTDGSAPCDQTPSSMLVEWSADCNGDGIVDYGQILDGTYPDEDGNGVPDCCDADEACDPCIGDLNGDGVVGPPDLGILLAVWGTDGGDIAGADINGDGTVNASDLGPLLGAWGVCP